MMRSTIMWSSTSCSCTRVAWISYLESRDQPEIKCRPGRSPIRTCICRSTLMSSSSSGLR
jgi:hypothetical protein